MYRDSNSGRTTGIRTGTSRRTFLRRTAVGLGAVAGASVFGAPAIAKDLSPNSRLGMIVIGCGVRGGGTLLPYALRERVVALVDPDEKQLAGVLKRAQKVSPDVDVSKILTFTDYRRLFDHVGTDFDAAFIATPNHHHALPALIAMQLGKHVYVEKPLCLTIQEGRMMADWARRYKVVTQMGNQGRSGEGYRQLCEYVWAGAIGNVTEVHSWTNRANGGVGPRPPALPVPAGMHWDEWIGPAPYRDFHADLHPHEWHGWHDFGNGSPGNMACHLLDGACWALKLDNPMSVEVEEMTGGSDERYPLGTRIRYDFPARGDMPPVKMYWYDGQRQGITHVLRDPKEPKYGIAREVCNRPPLAQELEKKYNRDLGPHGTLYVGDKGIIYTGLYGGDCAEIIPEEQYRNTPVPERTIPRVQGTHQENFLRACRGDEQACAHFDVSVPLTEIVLLGCLATMAGPRRKIEWDHANMKCTNFPELSRYIQRENREGWTIA